MIDSPSSKAGDEKAGALGRLKLEAKGAEKIGEGSDLPAQRRIRERAADLNGYASAASRVVSYGTRAAMVPLGLATLGVENFGVWQTLASILAWIGLDLGVSAGLATLASELNARGAAEELRRILESSIAVFVGIASLLFGVVVVWAVFGGIERLLGQDAAARGDVLAVVVVCGALSVLLLPAKAVAAIAMGVNLGFVDSIVNTIAGLMTLVWLCFLPKPSSVLAFGVAVTVPLVFAQAVGVSLLFIRLRPDLRPRNWSPRWGIWKSVLRRNGPFWLFQAADLVLLNGASVVLAGTAGPAAVPIYAAGVSLYALVPNVLYSFQSPSLPAYCGAVASGDWEWIRRRTRRDGWIAAAAALAAGGMLTLVAGDVVDTWSAGRLCVPIEMAACLAVSSFFTAMGTAASIALWGVGRMWAKTMAKCAAALVFVCGGWWLASQYGLTGMGWAAAAASIVEGSISIAVLRIVMRDGERNGRETVAGTNGRDHAGGPARGTY